MRSWISNFILMISQICESKLSRRNIRWDRHDKIRFDSTKTILRLENDSYLVGKFIRTLFTKTNRRCHVSKHFIHFFIMNSTPRNCQCDKCMKWIHSPPRFMSNMTGDSMHGLPVGTHDAVGSYSDQTLTNSSKWWAPSMEESRVR